MSRAKIDYWEAAELAAAVLGVDAPENDADEAAIEEQFGEKYGIDLITLPPQREQTGEVSELVDELGWIVAQLADIGWHDSSASVARAAELLGRQQV